MTDDWIADAKATFMAHGGAELRSLTQAALAMAASPSSGPVMEFRDFPPAPRPAGMRQGMAGKCFYNALMVACEYFPAYTYAEGLAWDGAVPIHHVVDERGNAVEVTWREQGSRYYGQPSRSRI